MASLLAIMPAAYAYGPAQWELTASFNCNDPSNPSVVAQDSGTGDGARSEGAAPGRTARSLSTETLMVVRVPAKHISHLTLRHGRLLPTRRVVPQSAVTTFHFNTGTASISGGSVQGLPIRNLPISAIGFAGDTGIPAVPGNYNTATIFGFTPGPGVHGNIQVNQLKN